MKNISLIILVGIFLVGVSGIGTSVCLAQEKGKLGRFKDEYKDPKKEEEKKEEKKGDQKEEDEESSESSGGFFADMISGIFRAIFDGIFSPSRWAEGEGRTETFITDSTGQMVPVSNSGIQPDTPSSFSNSFALFPYKKETFFSLPGVEGKKVYVPVSFSYHRLAESVNAFDFKIEYTHSYRFGFAVQYMGLSETLKDGSRETLDIAGIQIHVELLRKGNFGLKVGGVATSFVASDISLGGGGVMTSLYYFPIPPVIASASITQSWMEKGGIPFTDFNCTVGVISKQFEFYGGIRSLISPNFHMTGPTFGVRLWF